LINYNGKLRRENEIIFVHQTFWVQISYHYKTQFILNIFYGILYTIVFTRNKCGWRILNWIWVQMQRKFRMFI